jgi:hypothetical protein
MAAADATLRRGMGLVVAAFVALALGGLVTTWDGAWFLARQLETGTPTFLHGRLLGWFTQAPALVLRWLGGDVATVTIALGIGIAVIPWLSLLASWRVCGPDRRDLMVWPVLGIALGGLPGSAFAISEAFLAICLGWPIVLAAALGRVGRHRIVVVGLGAALAVTHPFAVPMLVVAVLAAVVATVRADGPGPRRAGVRSVLVLIGLTSLVALRYLVLPSAYEADTLSLVRLGDHFRGSVLGRPLLAMLATWALGAWLLVRPRADRLGLAVVVALTLVLLAILLPWASDVGRWERALMFRTFVLAAELPLLAMAIIAAVRPAPLDRRVHDLAVGCAGAVALAVLLAQAWSWMQARDALVAALDDRPAGCVRYESLGLRPSALEHWGVTALVYLEQAPAPRHLVVVGTACEALDVVGGVPLKILDGEVVERLPREGWFDLRAIDGAMRGASP